MIVKVYSSDDLIDWGATGNDRIVQNVRNIIRTRLFEIPFMRLMGINPDYIDAPPDIIKKSLANDIIELIKEYESRANVANVEILSVDADGGYEIAVELEV